MLMKEIKDDTNRWRDILGLEESVKMTCEIDYTNSKQYTDSMQSLSNHQWHFFTELEQKKVTIFKETQKIPSSQNNLEKEKQS